MSKYTFKQFQAEYPDDATCLDQIMKEQCGGTEFSCPGCGADSKFSRITKRRAYACQWCGHHIYPCVGTIFEKSRTPLTNWFFAMYLMTSTRHGVAAKELERQIGCTYKTAWRIAHELRKLMAAADHQGPMTGDVEVDETFIGGKPRRHGTEGKKKYSEKAVVFGMVEREGVVRAGPVPDVKNSTIQPVIFENVQRGSTIHSDEGNAYDGLAKRGPYLHLRVNHNQNQYVVEDIHTNTIEGFWSQLKRSIRGTHVHVSKKHLWKYVSEFSYRRNMRASHQAMFNQLVASFSLPRLQDA